MVVEDEAPPRSCSARTFADSSEYWETRHVNNHCALSQDLFLINSSSRGPDRRGESMVSGQGAACT